MGVYAPYVWPSKVIVRRAARPCQGTEPRRPHANHNIFVAIDRRIRGIGKLKPFAVSWEEIAP
jgi:hypothetical protein